ncbi:MAG: UDPGP type 1 family protein [Opitutaceae bacterium]|jgi:UDP-N-acetylglucosamine/UDP-N-acetylgalactosamine diphosphorylase|nr:UDPGP type 1 family protein [Opitutaceae bacterium]
METSTLINAFNNAGQGHVFAFFNELDGEAKRRLLEQAAEVDLEEIARLNATLLGGGAGAREDLFSGLAPAPYEKLPENGGDLAAWRAAKAAGEAALRAGQVAAFTVAGGQGTRLGFDGPKGTFPVTPVRKATLFQVFAEKILAAGRRYGRPLHWFIMTSHANHAATEAFFRGNGFFGLAESHVHLFRQGRMPAVGFDGKILLETKGSIAMSPDGHGGSLRALERSGSLDLMEREGVRALSYFQVDNPLVRAIDPAFIGWHFTRGSELSSKLLPKAYPGEKVGHFCVKDGRNVVVEYSDLPEALQQERDAAGGLRFNGGSIAIHVFDREFIRRLAGGAASLPFHRADKKIPCVDAGGGLSKPSKPNGVKFELFVFDALPFAKNPVIIETRREDDFSPVKNAEGVDSPASCRRDLLRQYGRWLAANGANVPLGADGTPAVEFEVSPLFGYDEDSFAESWDKLPQKPIVRNGLCL